MTDEKMNGMTVDAVVRKLGVTPRTLRYYEQMGLITPAARSKGGHRLYDEGNIEDLIEILQLKSELGFSLEEIREIIDAEESLVDLRQTFRQNEQNKRTQDCVVDKYIAVLENLLQKMDEKVESISKMRDRYQKQLDKSLQFRDGLEDQQK